MTIDRFEYSVLRFDYGFNRQIDVMGRPNTMLLGGEIHVVIESTECTDILEQMALKTIPPFRGSIKVYAVMDLHCVKHIEFETAYITRYHERMTAEGKEPMIIELSISATRLDVNRKIFLDRRCPQTKGFYWEPYKHPQPVKRQPAPPEEKQEEVKECTVLFRRSAKEEYDGSFGFDWLRTGDTGEKGCEWYRNLMSSVGQYDLLIHSEYKFFNQRWRENYDKYRAMSKYVIPWVTLMEGKTARFRIKMEVEQPWGPLELQVTGATEALSLNLTTLDGDVVGNYFYHTELEVTCTSRFSIETAIEVRAGEEYPSVTGAYKLYFINEKANAGGIADEKVKAACIFKESYNNDSSTAMHELLHCFEIPHTFSEESKYLFRKYHTDNIMDYKNDKVANKRESLWYWQIKKVWNHLNK